MALLMTLDEEIRNALEKRLESYKRGTIPPPPPNYG